MGRAKDILVKVIPAKVAVPFVKKHHYSGKEVNVDKHVTSSDEIGGSSPTLALKNNTTVKQPYEKEI